MEQNQLKGLEKLLTRDGLANRLDVPPFENLKELLKRLDGRLICRNCQTPYHATNAPSKVAGKCDECGGELYQRPDDTTEAIKKRLQVYSSETAPLIDYYTQKGKLLEVNGGRSVDEVKHGIIDALKGEGLSA